MNRGPDIHIIKEAMATKVLPSADVIKGANFKVADLKSKLGGGCSNCKRGGLCKK